MPLIQKKKGELISLDMIFVDEKGNLVQAIVRENHVSRFKNNLIEGSLFTIKNFKMVESSGVYRPVENSLKIIFFSSTAIKSLSEDIVDIPVNEFHFIKPELIESRINNNMILSGSVSFSTTYANKVYVNLDIDYIRSLKQKFSTISLGVQVIESSTINSISIVEEMFMNRINIKNLLESNWRLSEYIVTMRSKITDIINYFRWYYISYNVCSKKITPANGVYPCLNCNKDCKFPLVKYKIHIQMKDNTNKITFVLFNDVAEKFLDTPAHKLFNKLSSLDNNDVPAHIQSLYGKDFIFKLKLNSYNLKEGLENFTISKFWIPDENLKLGYKLKEEKKNLIKAESEPKDRVAKELSTEK
ncbi:hypothetical protein P3S68_021700 [Capsicum galapagoense]